MDMDIQSNTNPMLPEKTRGIELVRRYAPCPRTVVLFVIENRHDVRVMDLGDLKQNKSSMPLVIIHHNYALFSLF